MILLMENQKNSITIEEYENLRTAVYGIMNQITIKITDASPNEIYPRQS